MTRLNDTWQKWFAPRRRAERLIQARIDARRGEGHVDPVDEAWLEAQLSKDESLRAYQRTQEALQALIAPEVCEASRSSGARIRAPEGFAARVLLASASRPKKSLPTFDGPEMGAVRDEGRTSWWLGAVGVAAMTALSAVVIVGQPGRPTSLPGPGLEVSGSSNLQPVEPDFVIRAPGVGAAQARVQVVAIIERHGGLPTDDQGALWVRLPRAELVPAMQALAKTGTFKVTPVRDGPLPPDVTSVVLRFVLD